MDRQTLSINMNHFIEFILNTFWDDIKFLIQFCDKSERERERVKTDTSVTIFSEIYIQWKKEETDFIVPNDKFIPFLTII